jgi:hypothetical protein
MSSSDRAVVEAGEPPALVIRFLNPLMKLVLRSPLHRLVSKQFMLLTVTGRKTGRAYTVPVVRHRFGETLIVFAAGSWRRNLRGGAPVRVVLDGVERAGRAELEEDPDRVAEAYKMRLDELGVAKARDLGLRVTGGRSPTAEEIKPVVAERAIATITLAGGATP